MVDDDREKSVGFSRWAVQSLIDNLEPIGKFVGTYALAVFLVVYYAVSIYPQIQTERGQWIEQLTLLRNDLRNEHKLLSDEHARIVLDMVVTSHFAHVRRFVQDEYRDIRPASCLSPADRGSANSAVLTRDKGAETFRVSVQVCRSGTPPELKFSKTGVVDTQTVGSIHEAMNHSLRGDVRRFLARKNTLFSSLAVGSDHLNNMLHEGGGSLSDVWGILVKKSTLSEFLETQYARLLRYDAYKDVLLEAHGSAVGAGADAANLGRALGLDDYRIPDQTMGEIDNLERVFKSLIAKYFQTGSLTAEQFGTECNSVMSGGPCDPTTEGVASAAAPGASCGGGGKS